MRKHVLAAGIAAAALIPTFALAQTAPCGTQNNRMVGTAAGAGLGALAGSAVAGKGNKTEGAVIGGVLGAVIGNQVAARTGASSGDCTHAYGYYDSNGAWHANTIEQAQAQGYYDRDGRWVSGAPNGYYDSQGRWVAASTSVAASGYYDANGRWVPASATGYYDASGQWVGSYASGYYDNGRWVAGPVSGHYDSSGRWISGQPAGHRDARGVWIADAQPGYYDANGRWRAGPAMGYYDTQGRWIATAPSATSQATNVSYDTTSSWNSVGSDLRSREAWLAQRIQRGMDNGSLTRMEANRALNQLQAIRRDERNLARQGRLNRRNQAQLMARLDTLRATIRTERRDGERNY